MEPQSTFRTKAHDRYPTAEVIGDGPWGAILQDGKVVDLYPTRAQAAWNGDGVEYFGPKAEPRPFFRIPGEGIDE
jgi:hypothetical protein